MYCTSVNLFFNSIFRASIYRLKSHYSKLCSEVAAEREVAAQVRERLESAE